MMVHGSQEASIGIWEVRPYFCHIPMWKRLVAEKRNAPSIGRELTREMEEFGL